MHTVGRTKHRGVRVNSLSPGPTETPALGKLGLDAAAEAAARDDIRALVPIGRMSTDADTRHGSVMTSLVLRSEPVKSTGKTLTKSVD